MTTVKNLINQLKSHHDLDEPIVFQYFVAEHTDLDEKEFGEVADYLMGNDNFAEDATDLFRGWITEASDIVNEEEKEENA
jgi:hypothetical protein